MKRTLFKSLFLGMAIFLLSFTKDEIQSVRWLTNFEEAKEMASASDKYILMSFQGSDWCGNCKRLEHALFENPDFIDFASGNLIMLKVDFPMKKENKLSKEQTKHNDALAEEYNPDGVFPKVLIFNGKGKKLGEMSYPSNTAEEYIASIQLLIK